VRRRGFAHSSSTPGTFPRAARNSAGLGLTATPVRPPTTSRVERVVAEAASQWERQARRDRRALGSCVGQRAVHVRARSLPETTRGSTRGHVPRCKAPGARRKLDDAARRPPRRLSCARLGCARSGARERARDASAARATASKASRPAASFLQACGPQSTKSSAHTSRARVAMREVGFEQCFGRRIQVREGHRSRRVVASCSIVREPPRAGARAHRKAEQVFPDVPPTRACHLRRMPARSSDRRSNAARARPPAHWA